MDMEDKDRVALIMSEFNLTSNNFAARANLSPATLSHILTGRSKPTLAILRSIVAGFPELNPEWVMLGTGDMYRSGNNNEVAANTVGADGMDGSDDTDYTDGSHVQSGTPVYSTGDLFAVSNVVRDAQSAATARTSGQSRSRFESDSEPRTRGGRTAGVVPPREIYEAPARPQRKIVEIRIFFDDGTYETFGPSK